MTEQFDYTHSSFGGHVGVARRDISPPEGIYFRSWGAATHDLAVGLHQPLTATVLALRPSAGDPPLILVALDLGWWRNPADEWSVRGGVLEALGLDESRVIVSLSHTHSGPSTTRADAERPGGHLIAPYLERVRDAVVEAAREAMEGAAEAVVTWTAGRCDLARDRDFFDGERRGCGFHPGHDADDTVLVGRVTDGAGRAVATIVNYACHPTTLAWQNRLISPDYVGSARAVIEDATGAPALFLQGASGELAPQRQYTGDVAIAEANGRHLGHAVLATLQTMLPPATRLVYGGVEESGAPLAVWETEPMAPSRAARCVLARPRLPLKTPADWARVEAGWASLPSHVREERLRRRRHMRQAVGEGEWETGAWIWRLGDALVVAQPNEAYSWFQTELRRRFPDRSVIVMNVANGWGLGYLPTRPKYEHDDIYQVWQTPYGPGSLESMTDAVEHAARATLLD